MNSTPKPIVVARLTVFRKDGHRTIVQVHQGATFHKFYWFFQQRGARRSTKTLVRTASRNAYLPVINTHLHQPGLDVIARQLESLFAQSNPVVSVKLRIIKRRLYKRLITVGAHELGLSKVAMPIVKKPAPTLYPRLIGKAISMAKFNRMMAAKVPAPSEV